MQTETLQTQTFPPSKESAFQADVSSLDQQMEALSKGWREANPEIQEGGYAEGVELNSDGCLILVLHGVLRAE